MSRRVAAALASPERALVVSRPLAPAELAGVLGRCVVVLAMRYHAALFALAAGVPVAGLAYDPKVTSLLAAAGLAGLAPCRRSAGGRRRWRRPCAEPERREIRDRLAPFAAAQRALARRSARRRWRRSTRGPLRRARRPARFLDDLTLAKVADVLRLESERLAADRRETVGTPGEGARGKLERLRQEIEAQREIRDQLLRGDGTTSTAA